MGRGSFLSAGLRKETVISKLPTVTLRRGEVMEFNRAKQRALLVRTVPEFTPAVFTLPAGLGMKIRVGGRFPEGAGIAGVITGSPTPPGTSRAPRGQGNFTPTRGRARPPYTLGARSAPSSRPLPSPFSPSPPPLSPAAGGSRSGRGRAAEPITSSSRPAAAPRGTSCGARLGDERPRHGA